tara:strand:- start:18499 stop:19761 length:1263 start_codon:yes stop_codon:yes gene_type:complete
MVRFPFLTRFAGVLMLVSIASAQDDLRDRITLTNGRVVTGRIVAPHAADQLLIMQGGKRVRVDIAQIKSKQLVADQMIEFFKRRDQHGKSRRARKYLVDWANTHGLVNMARLQALELVLQDDSDADMHRFLGHRLRGKNWLWPHAGKQLTLEKLKETLPKHPMRFAGERFALSCDAGLLISLHALLDLERLGVTWFEQFGKDLNLKEVLKPIEIRTYRNQVEFPKWGFRPRPYFEPPPHDDLGRTFYAGSQPERPEDLFFLGTHGLLYRTLIGEGNQRDTRGRVCAWLEVGLGMHMQKIMQGPAGFAKPGKLQKLDLHAMAALGRGYRITHLVHLPMYGSFYMTDDSATAINWSAASMFTTWLLAEKKKDKTRAKFLNYIRAALVDRQGDSSTTFDRVMGKPIEQFDEPWRVWLNKLAGN